jgi:amidase
MIEVTEVSIAQLRAVLESGQTTAVELVQAYLARIDAYDGADTPTALNALVVRNPEALNEAQAVRRAPCQRRNPSARSTAFPTPPKTAIWSRA